MRTTQNTKIKLCINFNLIILSVIVLASMFCSPLLSTTTAQNIPTLIKDLDNVEQPFFHESGAATINSPVAGGNIIIGVTQSSTTGRELLVYSITNNTYTVIDINSGSDNSFPGNFTVYLDKVYFSAFTSSHGRELWRTDGTLAGTVRLTDIDANSGNSDVRNIKLIGNKLIYTARTAAQGYEPYVTDLADVDNPVTSILADISAGSASSSPYSLTVGPSSSVYFGANKAGNGTEIFKTDGTSIGTIILKDIVAGANSSSPTSLYYDSVSNKLYFRATTTSGSEPWISDGTTVGTTILKDIKAGASSSFPSNFYSALGKVFFSANGLDGQEPFVTDGTDGGTSQLFDVAFGSSSNPNFLTTVNGNLIFSAYDVTDGVELWKTDGTGGGTSLLKNINTLDDSNPSLIAKLSNSQAIFSARISEFGYELLTTDGTTVGTTLLKDIYTGPNSSLPNNIITIGGETYFTAINEISGVPKTVFMKTDGTSLNTVIVNNSTTNSTGSVSIQDYVSANNKAYYTINTSLYGLEIWETQGTPATTLIPQENAPGIDSLSPSNLTAVGNDLYFVGYENYVGSNLYKFNSINNTITKLTSLSNGSDISGKLVPFNNKLIFTVYGDPVTGTELWISDGTVIGTSIIRDIFTGNSSGTYGTDIGTVLGNKFYFIGTDGGATNGAELWVTDGTLGGTNIVKDINAGTSDSNISQITKLNDTQVVLVANEGATGDEIWISDGTNGGTQLLKDIRTGPDSSNPFELRFLSNGLVTFFAYTDLTGTELWKTDGTTAGTSMVKELSSGINSFNTSGDFATFGNKLIFVGDDGASGSEVWISDGTSNGTFQLKDIEAGTGSSSPNNFITAGEPERLIFTAYRSDIGSEIWISDGSQSGTTLFSDTQAGTVSSNIEGLGYVNGNLIFFANINTEIGKELYKLTVDSCVNDSNKLSEGICGCGISDADANNNGQTDCLEPTPTATPDPDQCPADSNKSTPGICGCGISDNDTNANGQADCLDPSTSFIPQSPTAKASSKGVFTLTGTTVSGATQYLFKLTYKIGKKKFTKKYKSSTPKIKKTLKGVPRGTVVSYQMQAIIGNSSTAFSKVKKFRVK